ncbi:MAG TPA: patatin-like phospholipase family protein [Solirubrobacteraceae bacterium]|nr:patatin-like phospholipase family protein [Solirubrobacteraceae bacterium]
MARASIAASLAEVPLLADLPLALRERLGCEAREVAVSAGEWLFHEGDAAHCAYVVRSGRLDVVAEGDPPVVIRAVKRGTVLGELALLQEGRRSASVLARRDSSLIEIGRAQFELLIREAPDFALALTRSMGAQVAANRAPSLAPGPPRTIAVIALDAGAPCDQVAGRLAHVLGRYGTGAHLTRDPQRPAADFPALLDRAEGANDRVLLDGGPAARGEAWTDFCRHEADIIVAVTSGVPDDTWLERPAPLRGCELVVAAPGISDAMIDAFAPREVQLLHRGSNLRRSADITARRLAGRSVGLVLSGGGARAFAHLGVLDELHAAGILVDRIAGVSMGSIVAGLAATDRDVDEIYELFRYGFVENRPTSDYTIPAFSLIRGRRTYKMLAEAFGPVRIEELALRFFCVSCDLISRQMVVHRSGLLHEAVYSSLAIPGIFPPVADEHGRLLVDGGVLDNLPVETMQRAGEGPVIAVDIATRPRPIVERGRPRTRLIARRVRLAITGREEPLPRLAETLLRTLTLASSDTEAAALRHADLVIAPRVEGIGMLEWKGLDRARVCGREAAREALEAAHETVAGWQP